MPEVVLQGYIEVPIEDLDLVQSELSNHIALTRAESGCVVFRVEQDIENSSRFNVYERFASQEAFEFHQQRVKNSRWGAITKNVARHYSIEYLQSIGE